MKEIDYNLIKTTFGPNKEPLMNTDCYELCRLINAFHVQNRVRAYNSDIFILMKMLGYRKVEKGTFNFMEKYYEEFGTQ